MQPNDAKMYKIIEEVGTEVYTACRTYPSMNSYHEGWAVIEEEIEELWDEVKLKPALRNKERMRKEAVQVAAMAIRFIHDLL